MTSERGVVYLTLGPGGVEVFGVREGRRDAA